MKKIIILIAISISFFLGCAGTHQDLKKEQDNSIKEPRTSDREIISVSSDFPDLYVQMFMKSASFVGVVIEGNFYLLKIGEGLKRHPDPSFKEKGELLIEKYKNLKLIKIDEDGNKIILENNGKTKEYPIK